MDIYCWYNTSELTRQFTQSFRKKIVFCPFVLKDILKMVRIGIILSLNRSVTYKRPQIRDLFKEEKR